MMYVQINNLVNHLGGYVNNFFSLKHIAALFLGVASMMGFSTISAETAIEECSKELLLAYFPESFVNETLKKFNVPQDKWASITKELNEKDKEVVKIVEDKAAKMDPNPLRDPQHRQDAVKIFRETLFEVFSSVLKKNGVEDDKQIQSMLDDIQQQKARRFAQCMEKHHQNQQNTPGELKDHNEVAPDAHSHNANKSSSDKSLAEADDRDVDSSDDEDDEDAEDDEDDADDKVDGT
jgi:hypothetical protein